MGNIRVVLYASDVRFNNMTATSVPQDNLPQQEPISWLEQVEIRRLSAVDHQAIADLQELALRQLSTEHYSALQIDVIVQAQNRRLKARLKSRWLKEQCHGAYYQGELLGLVWHYSTLIQGLYVHPHVARRGLGCFLLNYAEKLAQQQFSKGMLVMASSLTAVEFYKKCGYQAFERGSKHQLDYEGVKIPVVGLHKEFVYAQQQRSKTSQSNRNLGIALCIGCFFFSLAIALLNR